MIRVAPRLDRPKRHRKLSHVDVSIVTVEYVPGTRHRELIASGVHASWDRVLVAMESLISPELAIKRQRELIEKLKGS